MIELWIHYGNDNDLDSDIVSNAPCVPYVGALIETGFGTHVVQKLKYDYHPTDGSVRVHVIVEGAKKSQPSRRFNSAGW